jgi:hypothetical protein
MSPCCSAPPLLRLDGVTETREHHGTARTMKSRPTDGTARVASSSLPAYEKRGCQFDPIMQQRRPAEWSQASRLHIDISPPLLTAQQY